MKIFIDCEFNGFNGDLISMALITEDGQEFYEVIEWFLPFPWVRENVLPVVEKEPITKTEFKKRFKKFVTSFDEIHLIADWPDDIRYFIQELITGPGEMIRTCPRIISEINLDLSSNSSKVPHNALHDARAIMKDYYEQQEAKATAGLCENCKTRNLQDLYHLDF